MEKEGEAREGISRALTVSIPDGQNKQRVMQGEAHVPSPDLLLFDGSVQTEENARHLIQLARRAEALVKNEIKIHLAIPTLPAKLRCCWLFSIA